MNTPKCVLCDQEAITTAAQILVCQAHHSEYQREIKMFVDNKVQHTLDRPFFNRLREADALSKLPNALKFEP